MGQTCGKSNQACAASCTSTGGCTSYMTGPIAQNGHCAGLCEVCDEDAPNNSWGTEHYFCKKTGVVKCEMTIDNTLDKVTYNGQELHVTGSKGNWNSNKIITFSPVDGGELVVTGHDSEGGNSGHCASAGFAMQCHGEDSFWGGFNTGSTGIHASGGTDVNGNGFSAYGNPCTSTSGFYLPANNALKKIWAPDGQRW